MTMHFVSEDHRERYQALMAETFAGNDREFQAALYVMTAVDKDFSQFVEFRTVDFPSIMKASRRWSSGEKALIKLAACLFNDTAWPVKIGDVFFHLDYENTRVALEGLRIRYLPEVKLVKLPFDL